MIKRKIYYLLLTDKSSSAILNMTRLYPISDIQNGMEKNKGGRK
jgi:hypothetical protein